MPVRDIVIEHFRWVIEKRAVAGKERPQSGGVG